MRSKRDSVVTLYNRKSSSSESDSDSDSDSSSTDIETVRKLVASVDYLNKIESILTDELKKPHTPFKPVKKITFDELSPGLIEREVIQKGIPIVVTGVTKNWDEKLFSFPWLKENFGDYLMENSPRDTQALEDLSGWTITDYLDYIQLDPSQRTRHLYGKDITCPEQWRNYLASHLNSYFCYEHRDLVSHLHKEQQPETLMVYVGTGNTYTPGHTDICGSLGHNLMVHSDSDAYALWFIAESKDKGKAVNLWGKYGAALDHDNCFLPVERLAEADFTFYVVKQQKGELVFVPPEGAHQVINKGGSSIKIAWNRVTASTIGGSYHHVLPVYHQICKAEVYRIKTLVYCGLQERIAMVKNGKTDERLVHEFPSLIRLLDEIICEEWVSPQVLRECQIKKLGKQRFNDRVPHLRTCNFCNLDIFNRCYRCPVCTTDYDICLSCIAEGRGCTHNESLVLMEHIPMTKLRGIFQEGKSSYQSLMVSLGKKPEPIAAADFQLKHSVASLAFQMVARYREPLQYQCHQCKRRRKKCHTVDCANKSCQKMYCAMCLWNRYGIRQFTAQRDKTWQCPFCRNTCNCAACFRKRDPKEVDMLATYKALLDINVVLPPSLSKNSEAVAGVCDVAPKPGRSQGFSLKEFQQLKNEHKRAREQPLHPDYQRASKRVKYEENSNGSDSEPMDTADTDSTSNSEIEKKDVKVKTEGLRSSNSLRLSNSLRNSKRSELLRSSDSKTDSIDPMETEAEIKKEQIDIQTSTDNHEMDIEPSPKPIEDKSTRGPRRSKKQADIKPRSARSKTNQSPVVAKEVSLGALAGGKKLELTTAEYETAVLTCVHPGVTYTEYKRVYDTLSKKPRKDNGVYSCPCGVSRGTSQSFAAHAKSCVIYRACLPQHLRKPDDPVFLAGNQSSTD